MNKITSNRDPSKARRKSLPVMRPSGRLKPAEELPVATKFAHERNNASATSLRSSHPASTAPSKQAKRESMPLRRKRSAKSVEQKEPKAVCAARKQMQLAAEALNAFPPERRQQMLTMAALLPQRKEQVEQKSASLPVDARGARFMRFRLIVNAQGEVAVEEKIHRTVGNRAAPPGLRFSAAQKRAGKAQLDAAFLWLSLNRAGFHQDRPDFPDLPPNEELAALSDD